MLDAHGDSAGAVLTIDLDAIRANYRFLRERLNGVSCAAVVKADAYGLGALKVVPPWHPSAADTSSLPTWTRPSPFIQSARRRL
jgi:alanine racemase